jgi:hypothetical protein
MPMLYTFLPLVTAERTSIMSAIVQDSAAGRCHSAFVAPANGWNTASKTSVDEVRYLP